jgi:hypothetical protein
MEAGVKGIPWIASSIPSFRSWSSGGIISESPDEWHLNLRHLVMDTDLRNKLGRAGKHAAQTREMDHLVGPWLEMINQAVALTTPLSREAEIV